MTVGELKEILTDAPDSWVVWVEQSKVAFGLTLETNMHQTSGARGEENKLIIETLET